MALSGAFTADAAVTSAVARYSRTAIALHWLLAAALLAELVLGWWMQDVPKSPPGVRAGWYNVHKSIGITIALLVAARLIWRASHPLADDGHASPWQHAAAQAAHGMLYACMLLMPVTGFLGSVFTRYPIRLFGVVLALPHVDWPAGKQLMADAHLASANVFAALIAVHVLAALWHWLQRDGVTARMGIPSLR